MNRLRVDININIKFSADEVTAIVAQRLARFKTTALDQKVAEKVEKIQKEKEALAEELELKKGEAETAMRELEAFKLSIETGLSVEVLKKTKLTGKELKEFADSLLGEKALKGINKTDAILNGFVKKSSGEKGSDWRKTMADQIRSKK